MNRQDSNPPPHVLVVEDDDLVREMLVDVVADAGFSATAAANADEAWKSLGRLPGVAVVVTDVDMPGSMDGISLAARITVRWPSMGIVLISGRNSTIRALPHSIRFLAKPFAPAKLVDTIESLIDHPVAA